MCSRRATRAKDARAGASTRTCVAADSDDCSEASLVLRCAERAGHSVATYMSRDEVAPVAGVRAVSEPEIITDDIGSALDDSVRPYHELCLTPGAPVRLMLTINERKGLRKGLNAIVQTYRRYAVVIRTADGSGGRLHTVPRTTFKYQVQAQALQALCRDQAPLASACAELGVHSTSRAGRHARSGCVRSALPDFRARPPLHEPVSRAHQGVTTIARTRAAIFSRQAHV